MVVAARVTLMKPVFVQLQNSFWKFAFPSFWRRPKWSKYSTKKHIYSYKHS